MNIRGSKNGRCVGLHHRVRHSGFSASMDRYTIFFGSGVICYGQQAIESCVVARSQRGQK